MPLSSLADLTPLLTVQVRAEFDIVAARQRGRQIAALAGFSNQDQVRIATAVSEIARNAYQYGGGRVEFALSLSQRPQSLSITIIDNGPGIGIVSAQALMDGFEIQSRPGDGTIVRFSKMLPATAPRIHPSDVAILVARLSQERPAPTSEAQIQNRDLLETLESLRLRELELEKRHAELRRSNSELEETNRGVVALYAELDEKATALRGAAELKTRFLRHASHEFRTPLNSVLALSQLLLRRTDGDLTPEQERQVGYIRKAAQDLTEIVNDLLDLAKVEAGKTEVRFARIQISQLFGALRGMMRPLVASDTVALVFDEPPEDFAFDSDESKVAQILRNLISNALKFTEQGEVRIACQVVGGRMNVSVTDTGIGIAPEDQGRIFQEFAQVNHAIQARVKGTGLGLPLSRELARLLGGELTVASRVGQGSRFTLTLPGYAEAKPDCILIIDDEQACRSIARQRFRGTRYRLIEASGGVEGAERARFERPALILLDLAMRDRSGFDVLDDLKLDPATSGIPVLIHTAQRLRDADFARLAGRQAGVLPKGEAWPRQTLEYIRNVLGEPELFAVESLSERNIP